MKQVIIFISLLLHLNMALMPQVAEIDAYNATTGRQEDDVNTVFEWVSIALGFDTTADDEDDDSDKHSQIVNFFVYDCPKTFSTKDIITKGKLTSSKTNHYPTYCAHKIDNPTFDVIVPPPKFEC
jgi:hypothetical protein